MDESLYSYQSFLGSKMRDRFPIAQKKELSCQSVVRRVRSGSETDRVIKGLRYHSREVGEAIDKGGILAELLAKSIGQVVGGIGRNQEHTWADLGQLNSKRAGGGGLACRRDKSKEGCQTEECGKCGMCVVQSE
jgi:hypothetical protein